MCLDPSCQRRPLTKVQSPTSKKNRYRRMSHDDERGLGGVDPSGVADLSLKSKNCKKENKNRGWHVEKANH